MTTYVTAFLHGSNPKRSYEEYKVYFDQIVQTEIPIVLFLDHRSTWTFPENVHVEHVSLENTWVGRHIPADAEPPAVRSSADTLEYIRIQNTKPEFLMMASYIDPFKTEWFAWIDFGLAHVFQDPQTTLERLRNLQPPDHPCVRMAGIWNILMPAVDTVNWRFAGGFLFIHRTMTEHFFTESWKTIQKILPKATWEVNIWALMELDGFPFESFYAPHDDTMIP